MLEGLAQLALVAWLPGAALYRIPWLDRRRRSELAADERFFWQVLLSIAVSCGIALALGAVGRYRFDYLLGANVALAALVLAIWRGALRYEPGTPPPALTALVTIALVVLCGVRFLPASEYVIGGKDPGTYVNEGVQLAQSGSLVVADATVAAVPPPFRDLFFPSHQRHDYYGLRFMGFFLHDPGRGTVVGQFPHLFPSALAIGYGIDGLTGVRRTTPFFATLGVLAVYFAGTALYGRLAGSAAALLLVLNVIAVWFGKYPNAEVVMQAFVFASVLALIRSQEQDDRFFAAAAGAFLGLLLFLRYDTVLAIGAIAGGAIVGRFAGWHVRWWFFAALAVPALLAVPYLLGPMRAYVSYPIAFVQNMPAWQHLVLAGGGALLLASLLLAARRPRIREAVTDWLPVIAAAVLTIAAIYALLFRQPGGRLAAEDAYALRTYANAYVTVPVVLAAVLGYVIYAREAFWRAPYFYLLTAVFGLFFFYKLRIVQEYFWAARRFLPVILPATLMLASAAALGRRRPGRPPFAFLRLAIGLVFVGLVGWQYARAAGPVVDHVEFAGLIPRLEALSERMGDGDLVLVESRDAGADTHVVALPLAYIYARNVLVLSSARPDRELFPAFLDWARTKYDRVLFVGGAGTDLVSNRYDAHLLWRDRFEVPEYQSVVNGYPRGPRSRKFDYALYALVPETPEARPDIDIGTDDDLQVVRFQAKEESDGHSFRWTTAQSIVTLEALPPSTREVVLVMSDGGRPPAAPPARVEVWLDDAHVGTIDVDGPFRAYSVPVPPEVIERLAAKGRPVELRLLTSLWNPADVLGTGDDRQLGVMVDRVTIR